MRASDGSQQHRIRNSPCDVAGVSKHLPDARRTHGTVLVVDDDWRIRELVQLALEESGLSVTTAADGVSAIALIRDERPGAVVLDLALPGTDGFAVAEAVRMDHGEDVPIVVVTADSNARDKATAIGAVGYLGKPFDIDELSQLVERALGRRV
jgi:DNA-binding response OmpR family regulator